MGRAAPQFGVTISSKRRVRAAHGRARAAKTQLFMILLYSLTLSQKCPEADVFYVPNPVKVLGEKLLIFRFQITKKGLIQDFNSGTSQSDDNLQYVVLNFMELR